MCREVGLFISVHTFISIIKVHPIHPYKMLTSLMILLLVAVGWLLEDLLSVVLEL